jgi:SAM-dependent methyltransferase
MAGMDPILRRRMRVVFEVWLPGGTEFTAQSLGCRHCGFVIYSPRPTAEDVDNKYRFLTGIQSSEVKPALNSEGNIRRCKEMIMPILEFWPREGKVRVLDFGGGDGRLMQRFVERGAECFVVDYVHETVPGVTRLGDTLDDLPEQIEPFDFVISSHVIEHVAEPRDIMNRLRILLKPSGAHLVAVPHEIWRAAPLQAEPVTHVNFFTEQSLQALFVNTGYEVLNSSTRAVPTSGVMQMEIVVVGRPSANPGVAPNGYERLKQLLNPGLMTYFWWFKRHPRRMLRRIKNKIIGR